MKQILRDYVEVSKPAILTLVVMTTALGFVLADRGAGRFPLLALTLLASVLCAAGAGALNHFIERDLDARMERTKGRPLPSGRLRGCNVLIYGLLATAIGSGILAWRVNLLSGSLSLATTCLYACVYTPLKRVTWLNTTVGAIPGALPVMGGWAAATGSLSVESWILFLILFAWQHPHFLAIAWMLREDYRRGGFKMLPVVDAGGRKHIPPDSDVLRPAPALVAFANAPRRCGIGLRRRRLDPRSHHDRPERKELEEP